jgi:hypothetical protein
VFSRPPSGGPARNGVQATALRTARQAALAAFLLSVGAGACATTPSDSEPSTPATSAADSLPAVTWQPSASSPDPTAERQPDVVVPAGADIQPYLDEQPPGALIVLSSGRYEGQTLEPKDGQIIVGESGAVLDGLGNTPYAVRSKADDIVLRHLEITNYAPKIQHAPIIARTHEEQDGGVGWIVEDCEIHHNATAGLFLSDRAVARNNRIHHNGQIGLKVYWAPNGALVEGNEIADNNYLDLMDGWEDGGTKFAWTTSLVVRDNYVHDNHGPGLWTDIDNVDSLVEDNLVTGNHRNAIYHEISYAAVIRDNVVIGNGFGQDGWLWGGGIVVAGSQDVEITGNHLAGNANGISLIEQDRGEGRYGEYVLRNITVENNRVEMGSGQTGAVIDNGDDEVFSPGNIIFRTNTYVVADVGGEFWEWREAVSFAAWQAAGQDEAGRVVTAQP